ncbi:MAG: XapX domain-containing protein [Bacillota bacterium]
MFFLKEIVLSTMTGLPVGFLFSLLKLPVPAPAGAAGLIGIGGIFVGYLLGHRLRGNPDNVVREMTLAGVLDSNHPVQIE